MDHKHDYETVSHPVVSRRAADLGIKGVELRKCKSCGRIAPYVQTKEGWFPLFDDMEASEQDILLA